MRRVTRRRRRTNLAPETIDGLEFGMRLAANPKIAARQAAFWAKINANRRMLAEVPREHLVAALKQMNPAYIVEVLEQKDHADLADRVAHSIRDNDRAQWLEALSLSPDSGET